jgi:transposase
MSDPIRPGRPPYPRELRERAVRMVFEHRDDYPSQWKAIQAIAEMLDVHKESLRVWVRRAEVDGGQRPGLTTEERARIKELERENRELRRANEILKAASAFFGAGLDRQSKR